MGSCGYPHLHALTTCIPARATSPVCPACDGTVRAWSSVLGASAIGIGAAGVPVASFQLGRFRPFLDANHNCLSCPGFSFAPCCSWRVSCSARGHGEPTDGAKCMAIGFQKPNLKRWAQTPADSNTLKAAVALGFMPLSLKSCDLRS